MDTCQSKHKYLTSYFTLKISKIKWFLTSAMKLTQEHSPQQVTSP